MCVFKHIQYEWCECTKRVRTSTCRGAFQEDTQGGRVPSCSASGDWDLATFTLPGSCGLCQRAQSIDQISDDILEKASLADLAMNNATEQLFEYIGDDEPVFTSSYDECIDEDGDTVARIFINGTEVQSGRVDVDTAKRIIEQAATLLGKWNFAKEQWIGARESANLNWYPPAQLDSMCGIKSAYSHWFKKVVMASRVNDESHNIYIGWREEYDRIEAYNESRLDIGDKKDSIRGHLPYVKQPQRTTSAFPRRPSPLRNELKAEDLEDSDGEGEWVDSVDSDDENDEDVWSEIGEMIAKFRHLV